MASVSLGNGHVPRSALFQDTFLALAISAVTLSRQIRPLERRALDARHPRHHVLVADVLHHRHRRLVVHAVRV